MNNYSVFTGETKMYKNLSLFFLLLISTSISLSAYEPYGPHTSDKWQIWAYSTAAPSFLGDKATIIGSGGKVIREGTNGWTCQAEIQDQYLSKDGKVPMMLCLHVLMLRVQNGWQRL